MRWRDRIFPGARGAWFGAAVAGLVLVVLLIRLGAAQTASLAGTNSVDVASVIAHAEPKQTLCVRDLMIPAGTARIGVSMAALHEPPGGGHATALLVADGKRVTLAVEPSLAGLDFHTLALPQKTTRQAVGAVVCVRPRDMSLDFGGAFVQRLPGARVTTLDGQPIGQGDVSVQYLGDNPRVYAAVPQALRRSTVFESPLGMVLTWLALPFLVLALYVVCRVTATAPSLQVRTLAITAAALAFGYAACWAVLLHPFHGADESEHFAYAQYLAATDKQPDRGGPSARSPYSTAELRLLEAVHHNSTILNPTSRLRWDRGWDARYERDAVRARDDDGGGGSESATGHSPLYYEVVGLPYRLLGHHMSLPGVLLLMRLLNAALASLVAGLAVVAASLAYGSAHRMQAWAAGVLVGLQPVFGSVAGAVNNDTAVNLAAAALLTVLIATWVEGPTRTKAVLTGSLVVVLPVAKITGFGVYPVVALALVLMLVRYPVGSVLKWGATLAASVVLIAAGWTLLASPLIGGQRGTLYNVHPAVVTSAPAAGGAAITTTGRLNYFAQTILPSAPLHPRVWALPGATWLERQPLFYIYVRRGYGLFGWKSVELRTSLLYGIAASLAAGWLLAVLAALRLRRRWREWLGSAVILAAAVLSVLAFVSYAYATQGLHADPGEQGRYIFTAIVPLATLFSAGAFAFRDRLRAAVTGMIASGAAALAIVAWLSALRGWFL